MISLLIGLCAQPAVATERPAPLPEPLPAREMQLADPQLGKLSNGIEVRVAPNHEVPLFEVRLVFAVGAYADPAGKEGLAALSFDMLDEGAGERDSKAIAAELKRLAGRVSSSADADAGYVSAFGLKRNMPELLDVWTEVVRQPTFPEAEWKIVKDRAVGNRKLSDEDIGQIARRTYRRVVWGDGYIGRSSTIESLESLELEEAKAFYAKHAGPENAILLVGGDVTLSEVLPLLEERLGDWSVESFEHQPVVAETARADGEVIYLIDKPGSPQSLIRGVAVVGTLEDDDMFDLMVGNEMFGGGFTGRVNMNLREEKGYTYGAWCGAVYRHGPGVYLCNASVRTDATGASLVEFRNEIAGVIGDEPMTEDEVQTAADSMAYGWPGRFETTGPILDLEFEIWRYGKSEDWAAEYVPKVREVTAASANAALKNHLVPDQFSWIVVGDKKVVRTELEAIGLPILELDRNGNPVE